MNYKTSERGVRDAMQKHTVKQCSEEEKWKKNQNPQTKNIYLNVGSIKTDNENKRQSLKFFKIYLIFEYPIFFYKRSSFF